MSIFLLVSKGPICATKSKLWINDGCKPTLFGYISTLRKNNFSSFPVFIENDILIRQEFKKC